MNAHKSLAILATVSLLGLSVGCKKKYQEGVQDGKEQGYREGYDVGYDDGFFDGEESGFLKAKDYFATADYNAGFDDGKNIGFNLGYNSGHTVGKNEGLGLGYSQGYKVGLDEGYDEGWRDGDAYGYSAGWSDGYDEGWYEGDAYGYSDGWNEGYDEGWYDGDANGYAFGWDAGYDQGWYDGYYSLSVGKTKELKGYANILSMVHNELFDYSKIKAPKRTSRGLVVGKKLLLSETSVTNKDTLKRSAVVEQYLVVEMAKQVKGKFGLSAERSLKIAKAANHFRKYSSTRALTAEDTDAYASEIMGVDFKTVENAVKSSLQGNVSSLTSVIEKAAEKNETSPEKMSEIVSSLFF